MTKKEKFLELVKVYARECSGRTYLNEKAKPICIGAEEITKVVYYAQEVPTTKIPKEFCIATFDFCDWAFSDFRSDGKPDWIKKEDILE